MASPGRLSSVGCLELEWRLSGAKEPPHVYFIVHLRHGLWRSIEALRLLVRSASEN